MELNLNVKRDDESQHTVCLNGTPHFRIQKRAEGIKVLHVLEDGALEPVTGLFRSFKLAVGFCLLELTEQSLFTMSTYCNAALSWKAGR